MLDTAISLNLALVELVLDDDRVENGRVCDDGLGPAGEARILMFEGLIEPNASHIRLEMIPVGIIAPIISRLDLFPGISVKFATCSSTVGEQNELISIVE